MTSPADAAALVAAARPAVFWTDRADRPEPAAPLRDPIDADLVIVGGGFTGLWAALQAIEDDPGRRVVVLEATEVAHGASGRNGGFCDPSLTHGLLNGLGHWPGEIEQLLRLGDENFEGLLAAVTRHGIDADVRVTSEVEFAVQPWQVADVRDATEVHNAHGRAARFVDADGAQAIAASPTYLGAMVRPDAIALVDPARLAWGLRTTVEALGVAVHDNSPVAAIEPDTNGRRVVVTTDRSLVRTERVIVATNAWASPLPRIRRYVVPVHDHVLMTEPLSAAQLEAIGWVGREGLADAGSQFHYYRMTADDRILWGGYDANYHRGNAMGPAVEQQTTSHELLVRHFFATFPQLHGLGFSHRWAGPIGTTSRFSAAWGRAHGGRTVWAAGYTGLGVGAARFGARVALDLVDGRTTECTELSMVRRRPVPFPPEPLRNPVIQFTRRELARSDANGGRPGWWLRLLDRFNVGFDS